MFLKLQPYLQSSLVRRANQKLAFKYFGPFRILERIGEVAYRLELPDSSRIHPLFRVSQLKPCLGPGQKVLPQLPTSTDLFQVPVRVLQRHVHQQDLRTVVQVLVQWSGCPESMATREDLESLRQQFPRASAWGQADFQERGIVSDLGQNCSDTRASEADDEAARKTPRPKRATRPPSWLAGPRLGPKVAHVTACLASSTYS